MFKVSRSVESSPKISVKFRNNGCKSLKENRLKSKLAKYKFSKSTSELRDSDDDLARIDFNGRPGPSTSNLSYTTVAGVSGGYDNTSHQESTISHLTVIQKTRDFIYSIKEKLVKNRSRDRQSGRPRDGDVNTTPDKSRRKNPGWECYVTDDSSPGTSRKKSPRQQHFQQTGEYTTDYAADYSSDHSSSLTPSHSPFHHNKGPSHRNPSTLQGPQQQQGSTTYTHPEITTTVEVDQDCQNSKHNPNAIDNAKLDDRLLSVHSSPIICSNEIPSQSTESNAQQELNRQSREFALRQYSFFQLKVHLKSGQNLIAKDKSGTSDPYVKFKYGGKLLYKSKTIYRDLNPTWDEVFTLPIEDPFNLVHIKVFDYDWGLQDDFMGSAFLDLTTLDFGKSTDLVLKLEDPRSSEYLGQLKLSVTLFPLSQEDREQYFQKSARSELNKKLKSQIWSSVVTIVLIKGANLLAMDEDGFSDPYVKFRLANEKYKSKVVYGTLNPKWLEQFDFHMYDDQSQDLEITVWDKDRNKDDFIGKCSIDLSKFVKEVTHKIVQDLEDGAGNITLLLTISGTTTASETISDLTTYEENPNEQKALEDRYALKNTFHNLRDVGHLTVKVYKAQGLAVADLGGKSDPFCVLELVNSRLQTQTEYKTLTPCWHKIFTFLVKDINSVLEVTVYDEDKDHKVEFLGKVAIPLLKIRNKEKRWYALKDKKLRCRAKGNTPQILLELNVYWNVLRACWRTINPREEKYMQMETKFKRQIFVRNVMRVKSIVMYFVIIGKFIQSCFEWESTIQSTIALIVFILVCHYTEPYMIPIALLLIFLKCYIVQVLTGSTLGWNVPDDEDDYQDDDDDDDDKDKEEKKSLKERLQAIQEVTQTVQNIIGYLASLGESVKNTFNFTVPFLSYLSVLLLLTIAVILYWVPVRYLIMFWGINKFSRKLVRPHTIPNNEILDLLSRVPDDEHLISYRELKPQPTHDTPTGRVRRKHKPL